MELERRELWTVGHGLLPIDQFTDLLSTLNVEAVADVRSVPFSSRAFQFDRPRLETALRQAGIAYRFFGSELGGRPHEDEFYDDSGHVLYGLVAKSDRFTAGMDLLLRGAGQKRTAVLCSEADPATCHRSLLVGRVARLRGVGVTHILHDGVLREFDDRLVAQSGLPGFEEELWRSLVRVRLGQAQSTSSPA
jgi:uncharacterized protein (DUF488 family)